MSSTSSRLSKDEYFLEILKIVAERSTCARRAVGAIITDADGNTLSTGYNGPAKGIPHCTTVPCPGASDTSGDNTRCEAIHAEQNALLRCWRLDLADTIYVSCAPCFICAKMLINTPIKRVVCSQPYADRAGLEMLKRGINIESIVVAGVECKLH